MTPLQAILQTIVVAVVVIVIAILIATNKVTSSVGIPIISAALGTLTAPAVTQNGKLTTNAK